MATNLDDDSFYVISHILQHELYFFFFYPNLLSGYLSLLSFFYPKAVFAVDLISKIYTLAKNDNKKLSWSFLEFHILHFKLFIEYFLSDSLQFYSL